MVLQKQQFEPVLRHGPMTAGRSLAPEIRARNGPVAVDRPFSAEISTDSGTGSHWQRSSRWPRVHDLPALTAEVDRIVARAAATPVSFSDNSPNPGRRPPSGSPACAGVGNRSALPGNRLRLAPSPRRSGRFTPVAPAAAMRGRQGRVPVGWQVPLPESSTLSSTPTKRQW